MPVAAAQCAAAVLRFRVLEYSDWWSPALAQPLQIEGGNAIVDGVKGTGVERNEANVRRFAA